MSTTEEQRYRSILPILTDLIAGVREAADMNEGSAHSRVLVKMCDHADSQLRELVTGDEQ